MGKLVKEGFLRTKVARRQMMLFVLCALVPISLLALISYYHVTRQLSEHSAMRLRQSTKAIGMVVFQRLQMLDAEMQLLTREGASDSAVAAALRGSKKGLPSVNIQRPGQPAVVVVGKELPMPQLNPDQQSHLRAGKPVLIQADARNGQPRLLLRLLDPADEALGLVVAELATETLFGFNRDIDLPPNTELCIMRSIAALPILCVGRDSEVVPPQLRAQVSGGSQREFEWEADGVRYLAGAWGLFLKAEFLAPGWTFVLSESQQSVFSPMAKFKTAFLLIMLTSLWIVLLLSNVHIRRSLQPLERLREGTMRLARREFQTPVEVTSGDEFQELAESFNSMATRLDRQFRALATSNEIDRAVLASFNREDIVGTILQRVPEVLPCAAVAVMVRDGASDMATCYSAACVGGARHTHKHLALTDPDATALTTAWNGLEFATTRHMPGYLQPAAVSFTQVTNWVVFPVFLRSGLAGGVALGFEGPVELSEDDRTQASHFADQMAVGLSNAELIGELDALNYGALTALARVIDAKSPWTAGHSERVTEVAVGIARHMGLDKVQLETLRRGGLLHDIGKVAIPLEVLDKPGRLTTEEMDIMQTHVTVGARILEPIPSYAAVIPIVLYHHERFDGTGYPHRLTGEGIPLHARILAVADNFDALGSDRPYRRGLHPNITLSIIREGAGTQFDPRVVDAFFKYLAAEAPETLAAAVTTRDAA
jgi:putative nucleotidyltransferase with HDIG domain